MPHRRCVLVVDDDRALRALMVALFIRAGYAVLQARDAIEALELARENRVDLLVTDFEMPGMNGLTLISEMRARGLVGRSLIVTGNSGFVANTGPNTLAPCLTKPFTPEQLLTKVRLLLAS